MKSYIDIVKNILNNGVYKEPTRKDNNGNIIKLDNQTIGISPILWQHDMTDGFPLLTTKFVSLKNIAVELEGFIKGITDKSWYQERKCYIWDEWHNPKSNNENDLGPIYGYQWRHFGQHYTHDGEPDGVLNGYDQLKSIVDKLKNTPYDRRMICSAWNPNQMYLMALPPCFVNGKVYTDCGYLNIENIKVNDNILLDDGNYSKCLETFKTPYNGEIVHIKTKYTADEIVCTPNHPFLVKDKNFVEASKLQIDDYLCIPINTQNKRRTFRYIRHKNQYSTKFSTFRPTKNDFFMLGYFMGDGWVQKNDKIFFAIADKDIDIILPQLRKSIKICKIKKNKHNTDKVTKFMTTSKKWAAILRRFGYKAINKQIPKWVLDYPKTYLREFLRGYVAADGHCIKNGYQFTTISENLALSLQQLGLKLGYVSAINKQIRPKTTIIQNRIVNQNNTYSVYLRDNIKFNNKYYIWDMKNSLFWVKVDKLSRSQYNGYVYNISTDRRHTYTINNFVNHNCHFSWGVTVYGEKLNLWYAIRSNDIGLGMPYNIASYGLLMLLLCKEANLQPGILSSFIIDPHIYENHIEPLKEQIEREPYDLPTVIIPNDNWEGIFEWQHTQIQLTEYNHHSKISMEVTK